MMIVNVFDARAPGKHDVAPLEKEKNVVVVNIDRNMSMEQVVLEIKKKVDAAGGGPGSVELMRFFGHGNAGFMDFGREFRYWTVEPFKDLAEYMDPNGKGLELHGCYTGSAVHVPGQDCSKPGKFYPQDPQPGKVGLGFELLSELSWVLKVPVTGGVNCQNEDPAHKLEGPTITVSPDGITMRNVPIDKYDDRGKSGKIGSSPKQSQVDLQPDLSERIHILENIDEGPHIDWQDQHASLPDLSERIKILEDFDLDAAPGINVQNQHAPVFPDAGAIPDISDRIRILDDFGKQSDVDLRPQLASTTADLSNRIKIMEGFNEQSQIDWQDRQASVIPGLQDRIEILPDFEEREPFQPFPGQSLGDRFGADQFHEEREPFHLTDQRPMGFGAGQLGFHEEHEPFQHSPRQSLGDRFGADQLKDFPGHEPFQPFPGQPQWMNQGFSGPPQFASQVDLRPQQNITDRPFWKR